MTFGEAIRHLREQHGVALGQLAKRLSCSVSYVTAVERGRRQPFAKDVFDQACDALGLDHSQRAELDVLRVIARGTLCVSGLSEKSIRELVALRDELLLEESHE